MTGRHLRAARARAAATFVRTLAKARAERLIAAIEALPQSLGAVCDRQIALRELERRGSREDVARRHELRRELKEQTRASRARWRSIRPLLASLRDDTPRLERRSA